MKKNSYANNSRLNSYVDYRHKIFAVLFFIFFAVIFAKNAHSQEQIINEVVTPSINNEVKSNTLPSEINSQNSEKNGWWISLEDDLTLGNKVVKININSKLQLDEKHWESLKYGGYLPLLLSFEVIEPRWYWTNKVTAAVKLPIKISYDNLLETYSARLLGNSEYYNNREELVLQLLNFQWSALPVSAIPPGNYIAKVKLDFDRKALPPLIQIDAITNKLWQWQQEFALQQLIIE